MTSELAELFSEYRRTHEPATRARIVEEHIGLARFLARRFAGRGEPVEDLEQVAYVGLLLALERFDPERGSEFVRFAAPTITGELKRYLRDKAWGAHVPRRVKELHLELYQTVTALTQRLQRSPTIPELAAEVGASEGDVLEAMEAGPSYRPGSLDSTAWDESGAEPLAARLGTTDEAYARAEDAATVSPVLAQLPARERELLRLRFYEHMTQSEIAARLGCSQVHVSRLLARALERVRHQVDAAAHA